MTEDELKKRTGLLKKLLVEPLWKEANELLAIMTSSRKSASSSIVSVSPGKDLRGRRSAPIANQKSKI